MVLAVDPPNIVPLEEFPLLPNDLRGSFISGLVGKKSSIYHLRVGLSYCDGMSEMFRSIMRPICQKMYEVICLQGRAVGLLVESIEVLEGNRSLVATDGLYIDFQQNPDVHLEMVKEDITHLVEIVRLICSTERALAPVNQGLDWKPHVVSEFFSLCQSVLTKSTISEVRDDLYFILKNPLFYNETDEIAFLGMAYNVWNRDRPDFENYMEIPQLNGFLQNIDPSLHGPLDEVVNHNSAAANHAYDHGVSGLKLHGNAMRHYQQCRMPLHTLYGYECATRSHIHNMVMCVLPGLVAYLFNRMVVHYGHTLVNVWNDGIRTQMTLVQLLERSGVVQFC